MQDLLNCSTKGGIGVDCKPFKDTNLLANLREKFSEDDLFFKKKFFSDALEASTSASGHGDEENIDHIDNIKRIKIDETEDKNQMYQTRMGQVNITIALVCMYMCVCMYVCLYIYLYVCMYD